MPTVYLAQPKTESEANHEFSICPNEFSTRPHDNCHRFNIQTVTANIPIDTPLVIR